MVHLHNTTQKVDSVLCKDAGLSEPETFEKCGGEECAQWVQGNLNVVRITGLSKVSRFFEQYEYTGLKIPNRNNIIVYCRFD